METKKKTMYVQPKAEVVNCKMENLLQTGSADWGARRDDSIFDDDND